jgi:predicted ribosome quality control (RQC) complex YloA/Tae2 family protein
VIEQAASYAAFYSKSGGESLIRVLYTPKKYVRKAKNSPPGSVVISQEKVLLVKPIPIKI